MVFRGKFSSLLAMSFVSDSATTVCVRRCPCTFEVTQHFLFVLNRVHQQVFLESTKIERLLFLLYVMSLIWNLISDMQVFTVICYMTPLLGGIISDNYLGKYKTILYLSIVYLFGNRIFV